MKWKDFIITISFELQVLLIVIFIEISKKYLNHSKLFIEAYETVAFYGLLLIAFTFLIITIYLIDYVKKRR